MSAIVYYLPLVAVVVLAYLIVSIMGKNKKGIIGVAVFAILVAVMLVAYYYPKNQFFKEYNITKIGINGKGFYKTEITNKEDVDKILNILNRYTFTRSAVKTFELRSFPGNDLVTISMWDPAKSAIVHLYVLKEESGLDVLQLNDTMYNMNNKENFSKDVYNVLEKLKTSDKE